MKQFLGRFILAIPLLFIKQFPDAWIAVIALWTWLPVFWGFGPCRDRENGFYRF